MAKDRSPATRPAPTELDDVDLALLRTLSQDGRAPNADLAAAAGVAPSTASLRTRALRARGVLRATHADIDPAAVGRPLRARVASTTRGSTPRSVAELPIKARRCALPVATSAAAFAG